MEANKPAETSLPLERRVLLFVCHFGLSTFDLPCVIPCVSPNLIKGKKSKIMYKEQETSRVEVGLLVGLISD